MVGIGGAQLYVLKGGGGGIGRVVRKREPICLKCSEGLVTVNSRSLSFEESSLIRMARRSPSV